MTTDHPDAHRPAAADPPAGSDVDLEVSAETARRFLRPDHQVIADLEADVRRLTAERDRLHEGLTDAHRDLAAAIREREDATRAQQLAENDRAVAADEVRRLTTELRDARSNAELPPTADAYDAAVRALEQHRARADEAERERDDAQRLAAARLDAGKLDRERFITTEQALAAAEQQRDDARAALRQIAAIRSDGHPRPGDAGHLAHAVDIVCRALGPRPPTETDTTP